MLEAGTVVSAPVRETTSRWRFPALFGLVRADQGTRAISNACYRLLADPSGPLSRAVLAGVLNSLTGLRWTAGRVPYHHPSWAALFVAAFICTGGLLLKFADAAPVSTARNPAADSLAGRFADTEHDGEPEQDERRLQFAPRFKGLYPARDGGLQTASITPAKLAASPADAPGLVFLRDLPRGSSLSAGLQISNRDWAVSRGDLDGLTITLPDSGQRRIRARIEFTAQSGFPLGAATIELRTATTGALASRDRDRPQAAKKPRVPRSIAAGAKPTAAAAADTASNAVAVAAPGPKPGFVMPFLPAAGKSEAEASDSAGKQTLINLGVLPGSPFEAAAAGKK